MSKEDLIDEFFALPEYFRLTGDRQVYYFLQDLSKVLDDKDILRGYFSEINRLFRRFTLQECISNRSIIYDYFDVSRILMYSQSFSNDEIQNILKITADFFWLISCTLKGYRLNLSLPFYHLGIDPSIYPSDIPYYISGYTNSYLILEKYNPWSKNE